MTLTDPRQILRRIAAAREAGYAWSDQECYRGDLTIAAAVLGADGQPLAAVNISAPTSRWTLAELRSKLAPLLLQTERAAWQGDLPPPRRHRATLEGGHNAGAHPITLTLPNHHDHARLV